MEMTAQRLRIKDDPHRRRPVRTVVAGVGKWAGIEVLRPPYGRKPNDTNKRVWTDHYFVGAVLRTVTPP